MELTTAIPTLATLPPILLGFTSTSLEYGNTTAGNTSHEQLVTCSELAISSSVKEKSQGEVGSIFTTMARALRAGVVGTKLDEVLAYTLQYVWFIML